MTKADPALILGLRATFTLDQLRQLHDDAVNEQDSVTNRDPWLLLVDVLFAAAYPRDVHHCTGGCATPALTTSTEEPCKNCGGTGMDSTTVVTDPYPIDMPHPCGYCEGGTVQLTTSTEETP